ncbi:Transmembrane protein [Globisporangium polare]
MDSKMDLVERLSYISSVNKEKSAAATKNGDHYSALQTPEGLEGGALREGAPPNIWSRDYIGILVQYMAVGLIYGTLPGTVYPFLNNYLHMEGTQVVSARVLLTFPWSFKFLYGILTDSFTIFGYRRRPFMMLGWTMCFLMLLIMAFMKVGKPYYLERKYSTLKNVPEADKHLYYNLDAPDTGGKFIIMMMLAAVGYVGADVAADAMVVELAQREPESVRGTTQTTIYMMRTVFVTLSSILTGFAFNGEDYGGDFSFSISFPQLMLILAICCLPVIPATWFFIKEEKHPGVNFKAYMLSFWELLQLRPMYQVVAYKFFSGIFENFTITCSDPMQASWAKATPLNDRVLAIVGHALYAITLFLTGKYGLNWNWRWMHLVMLVAVTFLDAIVTFLTTWDVVRNQWFWLGVPVVENLPSGVGFIIATYVAVELASDGHEGVVYGLMTTVGNLATPFASTITKNVDAGFKVTSDDIALDTNEVRWDVSYVLIIRYVVNLLGLCFLPLLPRQKAETQALKRAGGKSKYWAAFTVFYVIFALCWSVMVNIMSIYPSTKCLKLVGGKGCGKK